MIQERLAWFRSLGPGGRSARQREEQVVGALACMVGGLILARAVGGTESTELLEACLGFLHRALGSAPVAPNAARPTK